MSVLSKQVIDIGIPLWIVDCSKPTNPTPNYILKFLQEDAELNRIIQHLRKVSQAAEPKPFSKRCAIYCLPKQRYNQKQEKECFTIMNADLDVDVCLYYLNFELLRDNNVRKL